MTEQNHTITTKTIVAFFSTIVAILLSVVAFFSANSFKQFSEIQEKIVCIQVDLAKIQSSIITRIEVKEIVRDEIQKYHKY